MVPGVHAQYFLKFTADDYSDELKDTLILADQAQEAIDRNHRLFARWIVGLADGSATDMHCVSPTADAIKSLTRAEKYLSSGRREKAVACIDRAIASARDVERVWPLPGAVKYLEETKRSVETAAVGEDLFIPGDVRKMLRVEPLETFIDSAREDVHRARVDYREGRVVEALANLTEAQRTLRRGYVAGRLTQARIFVSYAKAMIRKGQWWKARVTIRRGMRKLRKGICFASEADADAMEKILQDCAELCETASKRDAQAASGLELVEAKISALLEKIAR
jgi:tetratricopeptide (TPR) repeat protein